MAQPDIVRSFDRALEVIEALSNASRPVTLADVARDCSTTRATARRLLLTLQELGHVDSSDAGFVLRPKVMELGDAYLAALRLPRIAHPHLERLAASAGDTCSLTILDDFDVVYVDRVKASRIMAVNIDIGTRFPSYLTSTGRVLLAGLSDDAVKDYLRSTQITALTSMTETSPERIARIVARTRRDGYVIVGQELDPGLRSIAMPVRDHDGRTVAAVNVSTHVTRASLDDLRTRILPELRTTTEAIGRSLPPAQAPTDKAPR